MAVALGLQPTSALLNDINPHVINFYTQVQRGLSIDIAMENTTDFYYAQRTHFNTLIQQGQSQTPEAAQLFYYLNRTTYNGLSRFNMQGAFNAPFGQYKTINYQKDFLDYVLILKNWKFCCGDFSTLALQENDFIYADPPYDVEFTQYSADGFRWEDQERLVQWLLKHPGPMVLSNQATSRVLELYQDAGFKIQLLDAPRRIACNGDRTPAKEVLAYKNFKGR